MAIEIKLSADYGCWPLWYIEDSDNIDPNELPLSTETINRLNAWQDTYDATLNQEYPPLSAFENPETEELFQLEGISLWKQLRIELFPEYEVFYQMGSKLFKNPIDLISLYAFKAHKVGQASCLSQAGSLCY